MSLDITAALPRRTVAPGDVIFLEGQPADHAYIILRGAAEAGAQGPSGQFIVLNRMKAGEMFGEIGLLRAGGARTASVMSEGGCELLVVPRALFDSHLSKADPLLTFIIGHLCRRLLNVADRVVTAEVPESVTRGAEPR